MHERPVIAVNGELLVDPVPALRLPNRYSDAVYAAGGLPLALPMVTDSAYVDALLDRVDGVVLSGGDDFDMEALGLGVTHPSAKPVPSAKQAFDLELVRRAVERRIPILGVCYGMQAMALAAGGDLFQHLPEDRPGARTHSGGVRHDVAVTTDSKLARALGVSRIDVVSRHHQALSDAGPAWTVVARDDEGLIEAIERDDHPFALGVQWHPEVDAVRDDAPASAADARSNRARDAALSLFEALVAAARSHKHELISS